ncbi:methyltransferase domain-containing protein [Leptospira perolatii]|nr:methyltransferase domain-containing protein [Leptospira perolatii]
MSEQLMPEVADAGDFYDQGDELLSQIWDDNMHYGYWESEEDDSDVSVATERFTDLVLKYLTVPSGGHLLDIGCGAGKAAVRIAQDLGVKVTGINISNAQLKKAAKRAADASLSDKVTFAKVDAMNLPMENGSFDAVLALQSMMHMSDRERVLKEAARVMVPGGNFVVTDFYLQAPMSKERSAAYQTYANLVQLNKKLLTVDEYRELLENAGFSVLEILEIPDENCKKRTLMQIADRISEVTSSQDAFPEPMMEMFSMCCMEFALTPECGLLLASAIRK